MSDLPSDIVGAIEDLARSSEALGYSKIFATTHDGTVRAYSQARAALDAAILKHLGGDDATVRVPRLFDADAEGEAWRHWTTGGRHHEGFVQCINAYVRDATLAQTDTRRTEG